MKPYKKRAKSSWNCGKGGKQNSDCTERQFAKREIRKCVAEMDAAYLEKYRGRRKRNMRQKLEHQVNWISEHIKRYGELSFMPGYWQRELEKAKAKLAELVAKDTVDAKPPVS